MARVLVVEDEPTVSQVLADYLVAGGHQTEVAPTGRAALESHAARPADLVILDLMLPELDGVTVLRRWRSEGIDVPVIVLSARGAEGERVAGLNLGADDYVAKPASPREIVARVDAVLRRTGCSSEPETIESGGLVLDRLARTATWNGSLCSLRPREFDVLWHLARKAGQVCSREELLAEVWGSKPEWQDPATVTVHIRRLRLHLGEDPARPEHLLTVYGKGYLFRP